MKKYIYISLMLTIMGGCTYLSEDEQNKIAENAVNGLVPTGGELLEIVTERIPAANNFTRVDGWAHGTEIIYSFRGRCFYAKKGAYRVPDKTSEVDC